ncbi:Biofilm dispersion protein BdlA [Paenibacillus polymyxa E681]|uniref:methyl-accepting chemotaxis protein n=1 Tax=Paenibacillus polymyxa TaxID=1406 RepID=UPI0001E31CBA|nr:methyl-accepting chemotaxis protein [Paenibacillus polymyxa]ADM70860.1 histidine kinase [Paenibacillus polymyxa E681]QNV57883.1 Biofilm dispersion protein BdlA [Paenibacillus polymyxa E681]QNV62720.1 Biofilm dispersion protein BdlA [Paenibacillus polymyxa E681]
MTSTDNQKLAILSSIQNHLAMIVFDTQGKVLWANHHFASSMGYKIDEIIGAHHRIFCLPEFASSPAYEQLWVDLRQGRAFQDKIIRVTKDGRKLTLEATYMPVLKEDQVEAVVKIATDITKREDVFRQSTNELMAMVEEMTANTDEVLAASTLIVNRMSTLNMESEDVKKHANSIQSVIDMVKEISAQSHMLGLNAAIEAARAGEHGRGFEVVANEIRKMAKSSKESAESISIQLLDIVRSVSLIMQQVEEITDQISSNANAIEEFKNAYEHIASTTENLASSI